MDLKATPLFDFKLQVHHVHQWTQSALSGTDLACSSPIHITHTSCETYAIIKQGHCITHLLYFRPDILSLTLGLKTFNSHTNTIFVGHKHALNKHETNATLRLHVHMFGKSDCRVQNRTSDTCLHRGVPIVSTPWRSVFEGEPLTYHGHAVVSNEHLMKTFFITDKQ